jgi:hypothetical protein
MSRLDPALVAAETAASVALRDAVRRCRMAEGTAAYPAAYAAYREADAAWERAFEALYGAGALRWTGGIPWREPAY